MMIGLTVCCNALTIWHKTPIPWEMCVMGFEPGQTVLYEWPFLKVNGLDRCNLVTCILHCGTSMKYTHAFAPKEIHRIESDRTTKKEQRDKNET